jgi:DNA invertase Pin-like site-specific DNA recombinase
MRAECERRGWELVRVATDAGASGKSLSDRPELTGALDDLDTGEANVLRTSHIKRAPRAPAQRPLFASGD